MSSTTPFHGKTPRKIKGSEVRKLMNSSINPFTQKPFSSQYSHLLTARHKLPVFSHMDEFYKLFSENQILLIAGNAGVGKSTQIPQFITYTDLPHLKHKIVACTQPTPLATMSVAKRVANEMDVQFGNEVGYSIQFEEMAEPGVTFLKYMTDETLLTELMNDPTLTRYSTIVLDEVHERSLATDLLLALLKDILKIRSDLKLVLMSAETDNSKLKGYFHQKPGRIVPLLRIPGRESRVELFYTREPEADFVEASIHTVLHIHRSEEPGDILLFLTDEEEIKEACRRIEIEANELRKQDKRIGGLKCIPLYPSLSLEQYQRIFEPPPPPRVPRGSPGRKVIVATSIAETALTVDGIVYVVDSGMSKQCLYNSRIRVHSILASPISKAEASQRAARADGAKVGKCFRLYTERDYVREMENARCPGILQSDLAKVVLDLVKLGVKDIIRFDYVDTPAPETIMRAFEQLHHLAALDDDGNLTTLGSLMAEFPVSPQHAKALIASVEFQCSNEMLSIVAMLSVPNVWSRPATRKKEVDAARTEFVAPEGDHMTLLNLYKGFIRNKHDKNWAYRHYVSADNLNLAERIRNQLLCIMERHDLRVISAANVEQQQINIRKALVCGSFMQVAHKSGAPGIYRTVKDNQGVALHPSCGLQSKPEWVVFNEFILTTQCFIRTVTAIDPQWLLEYAPAYFNLSEYFPSEQKGALRRVLNPQSPGSIIAGKGESKKKDRHRNKNRNRNKNKGKGKGDKA
ncbi:P-loop containing nucleoside triphosphate hydrolase protein [Serendipita vermifera]|nr:P-loop containing nucleoside triphosphate hydrolase protein [Serendipita vermifera]